MPAFGRGRLNVDDLSVAVEDESTLVLLANGFDFNAPQLVAAVGHHLGDLMQIKCDVVWQRNLDPLLGSISRYMSVELTLEALREAEELIVSSSTIEQQPKAR